MADDKKHSGAYYRKRKLLHSKADEKQAESLKKFFSAPSTPIKLDRKSLTNNKLSKSVDLNEESVDPDNENEETASEYCHDVTSTSFLEPSESTEKTENSNGPSQNIDEVSLNKINLNQDNIVLMVFFQTKLTTKKNYLY